MHEVQVKIIWFSKLCMHVSPENFIKFYTLFFFKTGLVMVPLQHALEPIFLTQIFKFKLTGMIDFHFHFFLFIKNSLGSLSSSQFITIHHLEEKNRFRKGYQKPKFIFSQSIKSVRFLLVACESFCFRDFLVFLINNKM